MSDLFCKGQNDSLQKRPLGVSTLLEAVGKTVSAWLRAPALYRLVDQLCDLSSHWRHQADSCSCPHEKVCPPPTTTLPFLNDSSQLSVVDAIMWSQHVGFHAQGLICGPPHTAHGSTGIDFLQVMISWTSGRRVPTRLDIQDHGSRC